RHTRFSRDWSSDVCSSDLGFCDDPPISHQREIIATQSLVHHMARHDDGDPTAAQLTKERPQFTTQYWIKTNRGLVKHEQPRVAEIGRASCRERVRLDASGE